MLALTGTTVPTPAKVPTPATAAIKSAPPADVSRGNLPFALAGRWYVTVRVATGVSTGVSTGSAPLNGAGDDPDLDLGDDLRTETRRREDSLDLLWGVDPCSARFRHCTAVGIPDETVQVDIGQKIRIRQHYRPGRADYPP
jgi:hypothetical protein